MTYIVSAGYIVLDLVSTTFQHCTIKGSLKLELLNTFLLIQISADKI